MPGMRLILIIYCVFHFWHNGLLNEIIDINNERYRVDKQQSYAMVPVALSLWPQVMHQLTCKVQDNG